MSSARGPGTPHRLPLLFGALTVIPALALAWLTLDLLEKDRQLEGERLREQTESAADRIVAASHQRLGDLERLLIDRRATELPRDVVRVTVESGAVTVEPPGALAYFPESRRAAAPADITFDEGERYEYRDRDHARAVEWFTHLEASARDRSIRAGALLRLGRNQQKLAQIDAALATYTRLAALDPTDVDGVPAGLLAAAAQGVALERAGRKSELEAAGKRLLTQLTSGESRLTRGDYEAFFADALRWSGDSPLPDVTARTRAAAAFITLYEHWTTGGSAPSRSWSVVERGPVLTVAAADSGGLVTLIAGGDFLSQGWRDLGGMDVLLSDADGHPLHGSAATDAAAVAIRPPDSTGLPWTVRVSGAGFDDVRSQAIVRQRLRLAAIGTVLFLIAGSAYVTWRGVSRELAVVRLQSEFVAAVSHEFRTPLASLHHLSEMLAGGRVGDATQRQQCYDYLLNESQRLEKLVEELLDFGRLEEGAYQFRFEPIDLSSLMREITSRFQEHAGARGHRVELSGCEQVARLMADREALTRALWNLLDNAAKYSPGADTIWVGLAVDGRTALVTVRDRGHGIEPVEQRQIFRKFVRGSSARVGQVAGTGLGLAMVQYIVEAHRGDIRVDSRPHEGSTFAVRLPLGAAACAAC